MGNALQWMALALTPQPARYAGSLCGGHCPGLCPLPAAHCPLPSGHWPLATARWPLPTAITERSAIHQRGPMWEESPTTHSSRPTKTTMCKPVTFNLWGADAASISPLFQRNAEWHRRQHSQSERSPGWLSTFLVSATSIWFSIHR